MNLSSYKLLFINNRSFNVTRYIQNSFVLCNSLVNTENNVKRNPLEPMSQDVSEITSYFPESYNIAGYINRSETLQNLLHLNVNLSKIEKRPHIVNKILKLDFEKDIKNQILFLKDYVGIENIGNYITKNPLILCESLEDLQVRINYLRSKKFKAQEIMHIILKNPFWLMFSTIRIDRRLGYFQQKFNLCGDEVRLLATKQPKIITYNLHYINTNTFVIQEEMGFKEEEVKQLILHKPNIWLTSQKSLLERFNYLHNIIKVPHLTILNYPNVLLCRNFRVKQRHLFLKSLGRAQYDCNKENYIPIKALVENTDLEFCKTYAKCNVDDFNIFLKTL